MKKNNSKVAVIALMSTVFAGSIAFSCIGNPQLSGSASSSWTYSHYNAVLPTFDQHGSKEYWISCDDPEHNVLLTKPSQGTINEAQTPDSSFVSSLDASDPRYYAPVTGNRAISFEDGMPSFITVGGSQTNSISTDTASDGTHSLKVELTGSAYVTIDKAVANAFINLNGAEVLLFDVKCANVPDYTKPTLMYMHSATASYGVKHFDEAYANKGVTVRGDGIRTYWKTFMLTPEMLADLHADNAFLKFDNMSGNTVYIDNIRGGKNPATNIDVISFGGNSIHNGSGNKWEMLNLYKSYTTDSWSPIFMVYSNQTVTATFEDTYTTDGNASLHIVSTGLVRLGVSSAVYNSMGANDYIEYDYFVDPSASAQHIYNVNWGTYIGTPTNWSSVGKWVTFKITKAQLGTTSDLNSAYYCICTASGATNIYVDNVRVIRPATHALSFEDGGITTFASSYYGYTPKYNDSYFNVDLETYNGTDFFYQGNFNVSISDEVSTLGSRSLKAVATSANSGLYISEKLYNLLGAGGLSFDMYVTAAVNFNTLQGTSPSLHHWAPGTWQTITVPKENMKAMTYGYILFTYAGVTTSYIDNVRIVSGTESSNSAILSEDSFDWYE